MDVLKASATELGDGIAQGELDPIDVTEAYLSAIQSSAHKDRIYAAVTADRARAEAKAARERQKNDQRLSRLDGVPISWKDLFDTAGTVTEAGSALLEGRVPAKDAAVLTTAAQAGLICLGKTHMSELAFSGLGINPITATPPNKNDPDAAPGGSSSGAAASVAFDLAALGMGSDTGGSIRTPSAWNDLVGFKPKHGALSLDGVVPLCPKFDTAGPLARSVEDAAEMFALLSGQPVANQDRNASSLSIAVLKTVALDDLDDPVAQEFEAALARLSKAGVTLREVEHNDISKALPLSAVLFPSEAYGTWQDVIEANPEKMFAEILERFRSGGQHSAPDYVAAWQDLERYRASFEYAFYDYDAVILPTAPIIPPNIERLSTDSGYYKRANLLALRNTRIGNLMGVAGVSLPSGTPSVGIMLLDGQGRNEALLDVAAAIAPILGN